MIYDIREDLFERDEEEDSYLDPKRSPSSERSAKMSANKVTDLSYTMAKLPSVFDDDDEICFPSYDSDHASNHSDSTLLPLQSAKRIEPLAEGPRPVIDLDVPEIDGRPEDDIAVCIQPSRHVDYLSHDWSEEEVWSSYKFIVSRRKIIPNSERLENASWRSWEKSRRNLKTVSCETVKWQKDHDVTWLYGPFQTSLNNENSNSDSTASLEYCSSSIKPILKKLSLSQQMLQASLSSASLRKDSAGQAKTLLPRRNSLSWNNSFASSKDSSLPYRMNQPRSSSGSSSPDQASWASKNVRFHEVVGQCIALPISGENEIIDHDLSESDEDVVMMRRPAKPDVKKALPENKTHESPLPQTISKLPDASLKCSEKENDAEKEEIGLGIWQGPTVLTPGAPWRDEFSVEEEEVETDDEEEQWKPPKWMHRRKDSVQIFQDKLKSIRMQCDAEDAKYSPPKRPALERRLEAGKEEIQVTKSPVIKDHESAVVFDLPPCRSQLESFSFSNNTKLRVDTPWKERLHLSPRSQDYFETERLIETDTENGDEACAAVSSVLSLAKTAMVNRIMDEFWVVYNDMEIIAHHRDALLPDAVRKHLERLVCDWTDPNEKEIIEDLLAIIHECRDQLTPHQSSQSDDQDQDHHHHMPGSPRFSSDSGYGSEETDKVRVIIRDVNASLLEKEKGIQDWDLHPDAWDEDEAVAWERGY